MKKKIFITGGAGYVGSALVPALIEKNYEVTVYDLMIYGENVIDQNKNLKKIKGDIRDTSLLSKHIPGHDVVIHLACISNDPSFELNPSLGKSINLDSFEPLVKISKLNNIQQFIYASSSSVYGIKKEKNVHEGMSLEPMTDYSKFKVDCEKILNQYGDENFTVTTVRPATVCGYSKRQRLDVIVNILTNFAFHKREIQIFGGSQLRPNIHIKDMVRVYLEIIESDKSKINKEIFNAGSTNHSVMDIANMVKKNIGDDVVLKKIDSDDLRSYHVSSEKIKNILGFETKLTIEDAVLDLQEAFEKKLLTNTFNNENFFNIKKMQSINLK
jgi:nucleoside-diphosphate-sugar epimerase